MNKHRYPTVLNAIYLYSGSSPDVPTCKYNLSTRSKEKILFS